MESDRIPEKSNPVTLEALLRLKRYEQPPAEFWNRFDRDLEKKRLQAMVKSEAWYRRAVGALILRPHPAFLLGSASLLVFGVILFQAAPVEVRDDILANPVPMVAQQSPVLVEDQPMTTVTKTASVFSGLASSMRHPARISFSETDFGVDVIAQRHETLPSRSYHMDLEPASFAVSLEKSAAYRADSIPLRPGAVSFSVGSASF